MGKKKIICWACNEELKESHYEDCDGGLSFPVQFFPTIKDIKKYYKELTGETYFQASGVKMEDDFKKKDIELTHLVIDNSSQKDRERHTFGKVKCWDND